MISRGTAQRPACVLLLGVGGIAALQWSGWDLRVTDTLYALQDHAWRLRHDALVAGVLHNRAQWLTNVCYVSGLLVALISCLWRPLHAWRRRLIYISLASTLCYGLVMIGKALLPLPCPWDLQRYGGYLPAGGWLQWQTGARHVKGCFPAGHATGGYVVFAWFFAARDAVWPHAHWLWLAAISAGLFLGVVQQVRGAHFLSHDVATATLCWAVCDTLAVLTLPRRERRAGVGS